MCLNGAMIGIMKVAIHQVLPVILRAPPVAPTAFCVAGLGPVLTLAAVLLIVLGSIVIIASTISGFVL